MIFATAPAPHLRTWAEINLQALRKNLALAREGAGSGGRVMAVVKADAYGHGAVLCARALAAETDAFGVANVAEAVELREAGLSTPVFILSPALPAERAAVVAGGFIPSVSTAEEVAHFTRLAAAAGKRLELHLVVDTGMGRMGVLPEDAVQLARSIVAEPALSLASVASHFPSADEDEAFTRSQQAEFWRLLDDLHAAGIACPWQDVANSAGILGYARRPPELVRAGLMLYGVSPLPAHQPQLAPVMTWKTRVTLVRDLPAGWGVSYGRTFITRGPTRTATLGAGYADGFPRSLSGRAASVLLHGRRCPILGRVTMDQIVIDVSHLPASPAPGDEVVLLGRQGAEEITAGELAEKAGTIPWEIFTGVAARVVRVPA